jgi:hypothetical protein
MTVYIKENTWLARLGALFLRSRQMAVTVNNTICLHGVSTPDFLKDQAWLRHEIEHVRQFKKEGVLLFLLKYFWETIRKGYHHNRYEQAARAAENDLGLLATVIIR